MTLHHVRPPRRGPVPAQPPARSDAEVLRARDPAAAPFERRPHFARRDAPPPGRAAISRGASSASPSTTATATTLEFAYPILKKYEVPFAIYVATSFADRVGEMWWLALEAVIAQNELIGIRIDGRDRWFECRTRPRRSARSSTTSMRGCASCRPRRSCATWCASLPRATASTSQPFCADLCMGWQELATLAADPLVTIGAHTVNHSILTKVDDKAVRAELENSRAVIEAALGVRPQHLAYPVGDRPRRGPREFKIAAELGFKTAVTTRPGVIFRGHRRPPARRCRASRSTAISSGRATPRC